MLCTMYAKRGRDMLCTMYAKRGRDMLCTMYARKLFQYKPNPRKTVQVEMFKRGE